MARIGVMGLVLLSIVGGSSGASELPWLRTSGTRVVDEQGRAVWLRGTNFGSWLLIEPWIPSLMPRLSGAELEAQVLRSAALIGREKEARKVLDELKADGGITQERLGEDFGKRFGEVAGAVDAARLTEEVLKVIGQPDEFRLWKALGQRFSEDQVRQVREAYRDHWINEQDVINLKKSNMNMVRVPFFYQLLEDDSRPGVYKEEGWRRLDSVVGWCRTHGVYALLDMHGVPGGQNDADHSGVSMRNALWKERQWQDRAEAMWVAVAKRYAGQPAVLGYDLMNEPWGAPTPKVLHDFHGRLYRAIRKVDPRHILVMEEGYKQYWTFPSPKRRGWENVMYSLHFYLPTTLGLRPFETLTRSIMPQWYLLMRSYNVPLFVGEFSSQTEAGGGAEAMALSFREMNRLGFHWAPWTYKKVDMDPPASLWGLYMWPGKWAGVPMTSGTFEEICEAIGRYDSKNFVPHSGYLKAFRDHGVGAGGPDTALVGDMDVRIHAVMPRIREALAKDLTEQEVEKALAACLDAAEAFRTLDGSGQAFLELGPFYFELGAPVPAAAREKLVKAYGSLEAFSSVWMRMSGGIWFVPRGEAEATNIDSDLTVTPGTVRVLAKMKPQIDRMAAKIAGSKEPSIDVTEP